MCKIWAEACFVYSVLTDAQVQEVWEDGPAHHNLVSKLAALNQQREELEAARKALRKKLAPPGASSTAAGSVGGGSVGGQEYMSGTEFVTMDEIYKVKHLCVSCLSCG